MSTINDIVMRIENTQQQPQSVISEQSPAIEVLDNNTLEQITESMNTLSNSATETSAQPITRLRTKRTTRRDQLKNTGDEFYEVSLISNSRKNETEFLVHWKGYRNPTWEPLSELSRCGQLINEFYTRNGEPELAKQIELVGSSSTSVTNVENWVSVDQVLQIIEKYRKIDKYSKSTIQIEAFKEARHHDIIYLFPYECHLYVVLHLFTQNKAFIADGDNYIKRCRRPLRFIQTYINTQLQHVEYSHQFRQDMCGSSAALIALELARMHYTRELPTVINIDTTIKNKIIKELHPQDSDLIKTGIMNHCPIRVCGCGKTNVGKYKKKFNAHFDKCVFGKAINKLD